MSEPKDVVIECECDQCGAIFDISVNQMYEYDLQFCPFCGADLPEEYDDDDLLDEGEDGDVYDDEEEDDE